MVPPKRLRHGGRPRSLVRVSHLIFFQLDASLDASQQSTVQDRCRAAAGTGQARGWAGGAVITEGQRYMAGGSLGWEGEGVLDKI
jgi:hypothetical protein